MKIIKIMLLVFSIITLLIMIQFCYEDAYIASGGPAVTATPLPTQQWIDSNATTCPGGAFCNAIQDLADMCVIPTGDPVLTDELIGQLTDDLNDFWLIVADEVAAENFNKQNVLNSLENLLSAQNISTLSPVLVQLLMNGSDVLPVSGCYDMYVLDSYIDDLEGPNRPECPNEYEFWCQIETFMPVLGFSGDSSLDQVWTTITQILDDLKTGLQFDTIMNQIYATNCAEEGNTFELITADSPVNNIELLIYYLSNPDIPEQSDWETLVNGLLAQDGEIEMFINALVDLLTGLHSAAGDDAFASAIPALPSILLENLGDNYKDDLCED